jgi:phytoene synthase
VSSEIDPALRDCYEHCRRLHRRHDPTYYLATRRLSGEGRPAVHALYAYVRKVDELVDGPRRPAEPAARRAAIDGCERELWLALTGAPASDPALRALVDAGRRHRLPLYELDRYFESMRVDCAPVRIATWAELERYMQGSAGTVGRILAVLLGAPPERSALFARLGLAFQLTNFIRDVREDWDLDRVYLPREDLERFGVSVHEIAQRQPSFGFRRLLALQVQRARGLFRDSAAAVDVVAPDVRRGVRLARGVYIGVLDRAERLDFDVLRHRTRPGPWELAAAVAESLRARS